MLIQIWEGLLRSLNQVRARPCSSLGGGGSRRSQCEGPPGWAHGWEELGEQAELMCRRREGENLNRVCCRQRACSWVWENILWAMPFYCFGSWGHTVISNN